MRAVDPGSIVDVVEGQLASWLREKGLDLPNRDEEVVRDERRLSVLRHRLKHGHELRVRLIEQTRLGEWATEVLASPAGWVELTITNSEGRWVDVPRLAKYLVAAAELGDPVTTFTERPEEWDEEDVDRLREVLTDPGREGLVFVAGTSDSPSDLYGPFVQYLQVWMHEVYGLGKVIVLSPSATRDFAQGAVAHAVSPWSIRTFYPRVDLEDESDALRHRFLTTASLARLSEKRIQRTFGVIARNSSLRRPTPIDIQRSRKAFARLENSLVIDAMNSLVAETANGATVGGVGGKEGPGESKRDVNPGPSASTPPLAEAVEDYLRQISLVREVLGVDVVDEASLRAFAETRRAGQRERDLVETARFRIEQLQNQVDQLEAVKTDLTERLETAELDAAIQAQEAEARGDTVRWLRRELKRAGAYEVADSPLPEENKTDYPASVVGLVTELLPRSGFDIEFTGDIGQVQDVVDLDTLSRCAHFAWEVVLAMADYQRARTEGKANSGMHNYLLNPPGDEYRIVPARRHGQGETGITKRRHGGQRVFPVPESVDPSCRKLMVAHFKLGEIGRKSPRMYYYDDSSSGRIYIGYIGIHLTNTQSN